MRFKIDENLPSEIGESLRDSGHDAETVHSEAMVGANDSAIASICRAENRVLVTLDLDFGNIRAYPPKEYPGLIVRRLSRQDKPYILSIWEQVLPHLDESNLKNRLWTVEESRIRIRS